MTLDHLSGWRIELLAELTTISGLIFDPLVDRGAVRDRIAGLHEYLQLTTENYHGTDSNGHSKRDGDQGRLS